MIKSFDRRFLSGILALIFLLTMALSEVTLSQEEQTAKQGILRRASQQWMQVGIQQYQSNQFSGAEQSFRRALVFQKYLTDAERRQLNELLANARIAESEGIQAVASTQTADESVKQDQPVKAEVNVETVKAGLPSKEQEPRQAAEEFDNISGQPSEQQKQSVEVAEPSVPKIQVKAGYSSGAALVTNGSLSSKYMRLSSWLSQNQRYFLMIGLPILAVLIFISKLQGRRKRPGRRVYTNHVPESSSFIGVRLNGSNKNSRAVEDSKNGRSAFTAAGNPKRKSFRQSTEHWKK